MTLPLTPSPLAEKDRHYLPYLRTWSKGEMTTGQFSRSIKSPTFFLDMILDNMKVLKRCCLLCRNSWNDCRCIVSDELRSLMEGLSSGDNETIANVTDILYRDYYASKGTFFTFVFLMFVLSLSLFTVVLKLHEQF